MKRSAIMLVCVTFIAGILISFSGSAVVAASNRPITLKFAAHIPPTPKHPWPRWAKEIEKRTNGRVKIKFYWAGSLVKAKSARVATIKGLTDISWSAITFDASAYPLNHVMELPFMGFPNPDVATRIRNEIIEKFPEVKAEFKGTKILWAHASIPRLFSTVKKPIRLPEDVRGMKIAAAGLYTQFVEAVGGSPVTLQVQDKYMALERGVVDGTIDTYAGAMVLGFLKLIPYHHEAIVNIGCLQVLMNERTWKRLPPDIKQVFNEVNPKYGAGAELMFVKKLAAMGKGKAKKMGHTFITNTPAELAQWQKAMQPVHDKWIEENEARGLPAKKVYNEVKRLISKYSK